MSAGATVFVSALVALTGAGAAQATVVKADRVSIESRGTDHAVRAFGLDCLARVGCCSPDAGSSVRVIETQRVDVLSGGATRRELSGIEVLEGSRGTLTLRWSAEQVQRSGRWGDLRGRWFLVAASGAYSSRSGYGELSADERFRITTYRGLLITAW